MLLAPGASWKDTSATQVANAGLFPDTCLMSGPNMVVKKALRANGATYSFPTQGSNFEPNGRKGKKLLLVVFFFPLPRASTKNINNSKTVFSKVEVTYRSGYREDHRLAESCVCYICCGSKTNSKPISKQCSLQGWSCPPTPLQARLPSGLELPDDNRNSELCSLRHGAGHLESCDRGNGGKLGTYVVTCV